MIKLVQSWVTSPRLAKVLLPSIILCIAQPSWHFFLSGTSSYSMSWKLCPKRLYRLHWLVRISSVVQALEVAQTWWWKTREERHGERRWLCLEKCFCLTVSQKKCRAAGKREVNRLQSEKVLFFPSDSWKKFWSYYRSVCTTGFTLRTAPPG